jgi:hypothetical protein
MFDLKFINRKKRIPFYKHHFAVGHGITSKSNGMLTNYKKYLNLNNEIHILVIGSGSGLIPIFFHEELINQPDSTVTLLDAGMPSAGFGHPWGEQGWAYSNSDLYKFHPEILLILNDSFIGLQYLKSNDKKYNLIFIDANHSEKFVLSDMENSIEVLDFDGVLILHDGNLISVQNAIDKFLEKNRPYKIIEQIEIGAGAIVIGKVGQ